MQPRQHEADQRDGVLRLIETHLRDQPQPQPTNRRLLWFTSLQSLFVHIIPNRHGDAGEALRPIQPR
jgi:hypothetical protein